jgi:hypothetical protein
MAFGRKGTSEAVAGEHVYRQMISPVLREFGYTPLRADEIPHPGSITRQIVDLLRHSPLVVADLTTANPNVYYELGIRHSFMRAGTILVAQDGEQLPFDVANYRVLFYSPGAPSDFAERLARRVRAIEERPADSDNPVHDFHSEDAAHDFQDANSLHCACHYKLRDLQESLTKVVARASRASDCKLALHVSPTIFNAVDAPDAPLIDAIRDVRVQLAIRDGFILPPIDVIEDRALKPGVITLRRDDEELLLTRYGASDVFVAASPDSRSATGVHLLTHPLAGTTLLRVKKSTVGEAVANGGRIVPTSHIVAAEVGRVCLKVRNSLELRRERR